MPTPTIDPKEFQVRAEHKRNEWFVTAPRGLPASHLLTADPWKDFVEHQNKKLLGPFDLIRVRASDGAYDYLFTVVAFRKDGTPVLQYWPRAQRTEQPAAIAPSVPAAPKSRAEALAVLGLHESADDELITRTANALRASWFVDHATGPADRALREARTKAINGAIDLLLKRRAA